jgi:acetolactate synthase-1/2/3 large subunit
MPISNQLHTIPYSFISRPRTEGGDSDMNVADFLARFLSTAGATRVFGLPGGENVPVIEAFRRAGLEYVLVHHEATAGFAADVTGQLTGRPGVCMATVGPGAMNLLSTAVSATLERSPVLAITADIDPDLLPRVSHMRVDLSALFGAGTKGSFRLNPETIRADLQTAWRLAMRPPRGAVHLSIAPEIARAAVVQRAGEQAPARNGRAPASSEKIEDAVLRIRRAENLFILAGLGVEASGCRSALLALAEKWQAPLAVTPKAKGQFPESHPLYAGCLSAYGDQPLRQALEEADLIVGAGLDGVDLVTSVWKIGTPLVNLAAGNARDPVFRPILAIEGDLDELLALVSPGRSPDPAGMVRAKALRTGIAERLRVPLSNEPGTVGLNELIDALRVALPPQGIVTVDVGAFKLIFLQQWRTDHPKTFFVANGLSAMGYAIPAAIAVSLELMNQPVVAVVGDGALMMYAGELASVARIGRPLVILVIVDQALSLIRLKQLRQELPIHGTEFGVTDYQALAGAFGLSYRLIDGTNDAAKCLAEVLQLDRPILVEARVDKQQYDHFR